MWMFLVGIALGVGGALAWRRWRSAPSVEAAGGKWDTDLRSKHHQLSEALTGFRLYLRHGIADAVLQQYALDVLEQAHAVSLLAPTPVCRAGISNARGAYEAALYMLALTGSQSEYDRSGVFARACELVEIEALNGRRASADAKLGLDTPEATRTPEELLEADADAWAKEHPGAQAFCAAIIAQVRADKRWKRHWTGDSGWKEVAASVSKSWETQAGFVEMADALYGLESYHSHPRPRVGARQREVDPKGRHVVGPRPRDGELAAALASMACQFALAALKRRRSFDDAAGTAVESK